MVEKLSAISPAVMSLFASIISIFSSCFVRKGFESISQQTLTSVRIHEYLDIYLNIIRKISAVIPERPGRRFTSNRPGPLPVTICSVSFQHFIFQPLRGFKVHISGIVFLQQIVGFSHQDGGYASFIIRSNRSVSLLTCSMTSSSFACIQKQV